LRASSDDAEARKEACQSFVDHTEARVALALKRTIVSSAAVGSERGEIE
jgi:hypothetical protein